MKGLIYKDFLCLRKNIRTFAFVTVGMIIMGIMFLLSSQYGNVAVMFEETMQESGMEAEDFNQVMRISVWFVLILPVCFIADVTQCFREDNRVGFHKVLSGVALTPGQIVGSRYLTTLIYGAVSMTVAMFCAFLITVVPSKITLDNLYIGIITVTAGFLLYMSFNLFMIYLCGARRADLIQMLPLIVMLVADGVLAGKFGSMTDEQMNTLIRNATDVVLWFLENGYKILIPAAVAGMLLSYAGSVAVYKRRRRVL